MKKEIFIMLGLVLMLSFASAEIIVMTPTNTIYNLGDNLDFTIKIITTQQINDVLSIDLICGSATTEVYKEFISLNNQEKIRDLSIPLTKDFIGNSLGACHLEYNFGQSKATIPGEFKISNTINLDTGNYSVNEISPGDKITIPGTAIKENNEPATGFIEAYLYSPESKSITFTNLINNGQFNLDITIPSAIKAGDYSLVLHAYEKSNNVITNEGNKKMQLTIKQIPTNLEIILDSTELKPTDILKGKIILHDQSGEEIFTTAYVAIKNSNNEIIQRIETTTGKTFEYPIKQFEAPSIWKVSALASGFQNQISFAILTDKKINTEIVNNTLIITNVGNVFYNDNVNVTIGNQIKTLNVALSVGESKKFYLRAPNGNYIVSVGNYIKEVSLTGKAVDVKNASEKKFLMSPIIWIFVIIVLALLALFIFRRVRKKPYIGKKGKPYKTIKGGNVNRLNKDIVVLEESSAKKTMINPKTNAEIATSIHGTKQNATIVLIHMKNYEQFVSGAGNTKETLQKITDFAENNKAVVYENKNNHFFLLVPSKTRTFDNEMNAIKIAQEADNLLKNHNKLFKQKILYGIGIETGEIVLNTDKNIQFMPIGNLMTSLKRIASLANNEISLSDKIKTKVATNIIAEKRNVSGYSANILKGVTKRGEHSTFIRGFMDRMERDKMKQQQQAPKEEPQSSENDSDIFIE